MRSILPPDREAEFRAAFPDRSDADLAEAFGLTVRQAQYLGFKAGLSKTHATRSASRRNRVANGEALTVRVERAVAQAAQHGLNREQVERILPDATPGGINGAINKLTGDGRIHRAGRKGHSRWFITTAFAQDFLAQQQAAKFNPAPLLPSPTPVVHIARQAGPAQQGGEPLIPPGVHKQIGHPVPGPEGRWHSNARPILRNLGPGVYTDAASSWVKAITSGSKATA